MPAKSLTRLEAALSGLAGTPVSLERPTKAEHGDYATNVALQLAPSQRRPPRELAQELAERAATLPEVERAEIAGPGFVNLWLEPRLVRRGARRHPRDGERLRRPGTPSRAERMQVEMVSANPTGPIVVSAARNGAYGDSVARLLAFAGNEVEREYYYNDAGRQMELFRESVEAIRRGEAPPEDGYRGEYVEELAAVEGDPVPPVLERIEATLERFRIHFDSWALQSELEQRVPELLARIDTYEKDGAVWARSSEFGDDQDRVVIRSNGLPTYRAADIVYLDDKLSRGFDRALYVLGADHHGTRNWYAAVARMLGYDPERVEVLLYQLVHLLRAGEVGEDVEAGGRHRRARRAAGRDRRRRGPLVPRLAQPRPDDRDRRRPRGREDAEEPRLLRAVRARADRRDHAQRRHGGRGRDPARRARRRGARARQAPGRVPGRRRGGDRATRRRTSSRTTRSTSPTTSTASTTTTACSRAATRSRSGSPSAARRRRSSRARST